mmetsp:Transcript_44600/g.79966  ORF Transcript_44600/g.79966 Transcript_44600/m.79966 type:complete len:111 (+) Transcript_44600:607-939(+)
MFVCLDPTPQTLQHSSQGYYTHLFQATPVQGVNPLDPQVTPFHNVMGALLMFPLGHLTTTVAKQSKNCPFPMAAYDEKESSKKAQKHRAGVHARGGGGSFGMGAINFLEG